ncbi:alpha/beta fold hydrolase [Aquabacterium soli]|uniref:Alpha/beta fold hydrolase n=2 Tax=Aquabacterium soli TaxID=2493092 RepID=A0A3R8T572_9BURK|nr:alpha/beta fold hydrolase [Aquabacterium soli]
MNRSPMSTSAESVELRFSSGDSWCAATFYRPVRRGPCPVIVMAHGVGGVKAMRLPAFAERFARAGYACFVFDYRHLGESGGEPRQLVDISRQLEDWKAAMACARAQPEVLPSKLILWGTSFSGGHVLSVAADTPDVAAVVSQCPFTDGLASSLALDFATSIKVSALAILDRVGSWLGRQPVHVALAAPPGQTALMNAPDAFTGFRALHPAGSHIPDYIAARFALDIVRYHPGRRTRDIKAPVLFCVCETDSVAPAKATLRHAARAPHKEIKRYAEGHFEIYLGAAFERAVADQLTFLQRVVPVR